MSGPLSGVRVLDLAGPISAYGTKLLAQLGAEVLLVEPPGGERMRRQPPFVHGVEERSLLFAYYHADKRGLTLDVAHPDAVELLRELAATSDVAVVSPGPRTPLAGYDDASASVSWAGDDLVVCALTPYGLTGPWRHRRATAMTSFAGGGQMHRSGYPDGPPLPIPGRQVWDEAGVVAATSVISALRIRPEVGGQLIDLSVHEMTSFKDDNVDRYDVMAEARGRERTVGLPPTGTWMCADGPFNVGAHQAHHWEAFLAMLDHPDDLAEPALADPMVRMELFDSVSDVISRLLAKESREDLFERGQAAGLPCAVQLTPEEFINDVQVVARGFVQTVQDPELGTIRVPGAAFVATPPLLRGGRPAPRLGQDDVAVYVGELGHDPAQLAAWREAGLV